MASSTVLLPKCAKRFFLLDSAIPLLCAVISQINGFSRLIYCSIVFLRFNLLCTFEMISRRNNEANKIPHNDRYRWYRPTYGEVDAFNIFFLFNIFMFFFVFVFFLNSILFIPLLYCSLYSPFYERSLWRTWLVPFTRVACSQEKTGSTIPGDAADVPIMWMCLLLKKTYKKNNLFYF